MRLTSGFSLPKLRFPMNSIYCNKPATIFPTEVALTEMLSLVVFQVDPYIPPEPSPIPDVPRPEPGQGQEFNDLREACLRRRELFEDPDFPATDSSLFFSKRPPVRIQWLRPGVRTNGWRYFFSARVTSWRRLLKKIY